MVFVDIANIINPGCQRPPKVLNIISDNIIISAITADEPKTVNIIIGTIMNFKVDLVLLLAYLRNSAVSLRGGFPGYALTVFIGFNDK